MNAAKPLPNPYKKPAPLAALRSPLRKPRRASSIGRVGLLACLASLLLMHTRCYADGALFGYDFSGGLVLQTNENSSAPQILGQPQMQVVIPGKSASFSVSVKDPLGVSYQWFFNGSAISGATADSLLITSVTTNNEGLYSVIVSNPSGVVPSSSANLYIDTDGDGLPDSWELAHFGNLNQTATGDPDGDGVSNLQEFLDGTDPANAASALYRIALLNDGGTVVAVPSQTSYTNGQVVTLTATGSNSAPFHAWTGDVVSRSNSITVTMTTNLTLFAHFQPFSINWTNTLSGDWNVASNWFPNLVPGSNESVVIEVQVVTVTLNGNADLHDLTLGGNYNGPELDVAGRLTIAGTCTWEGGTMGGAGTTVVLPGASFNIISVTTPTLSGRTLENAGTMSWMGGYLFLAGAVITNDAGSQFAVEGSGSFSYGSGAPRFDNAGTLVTATNATTVFEGVAFNNYATVTIQGGTFSMDGGGVQAGNMPVPAGTTLNFAGGTFTSSNSLSITGGGTLIVSGGTSTLGGTVNVTGSNIFSNGSMDFTGNYTCVGDTVLDISGGTVNFDGTSVVTPNQVNLYGALGGANTVTVGSVMNWTGGSMNGSGRTIIQPGATLNIAAFTGYGGVYLFDRTLENAGTVIWGGGNLGMSGVITNDAGASFQILNAAMFNYQGNTPRFDNAGTFLPSSTGTTAFNGIPFDNYGAVNLTGGSDLYFTGGGMISGPITVPAGATINFGGGVFNAGASSSITGTGWLQVSGGTANLAGTVNVSGTNSFINGTANLTGNYTCVGSTLLDISGGTVNFNGSGTVSPNQVNLYGALGGANTVTVGSVMNWTGGNMNTGSGRTIIQPGATLNIAAFTGYGGVYLFDRTLENAGTVIWGGGNLGMSGVITNDAGASFQILNAAMFNYQGNTPRFDNAGTFLPSSTGTTAFNGIPFDNYGAVNLTGGSDLYFTGGGMISGPITVPAGATINFGGGVFNAGASSSITGTGWLQVSGGTANLAGTVNVSGTNSFINGTANLTGNYTCVGSTLLDISGGTVNFNGSGTVSPNQVNLYGALGGANTVRVGKVINWTGGSMNGSGRTIIQPGATLNIPAFTGYGGVYLYDRTLENAGTVIWGGGNLDMSGAITNDAGASFQILDAAMFNYEGGNPRFDNAGTFKTAGSGVTAFNGVALNNFNTVSIPGGTLNAGGGYVCSSNSILNCALWGTVPGATFGQLQAYGTVNVKGSLSVYLTNHFVPKTNDSFAVLTAASASGAFGGFTYPSNSISMTLTNSPSSEIVQVTGVSLKQTNSIPAPQGMISWWRGENDAIDSIGTNNGAITNGVTYAPGEVGQSFLFDGSTGWVSIPDSPSLRPASVTLEAWVKIFNTNAIQLVFAKPLGTSTLDSYGLALENGVPLAAICDTSGFGTFVSDTTVLSLGQWHHMAFTFDAATGLESLYTDGAMVASANAGISMDFDNHPLLLGADNDNNLPDNFLNGQIDEASIYDRALTANEIGSIYNVGDLGKELVQLVSPGAPALYVEMITPATAQFYWSTNFSNYHLEFNTTLSSTNWAAVLTSPATVGSNNVVTNPIVGSQQFYRLSNR